MKYAKRILTGFYILISMFSFLSLEGCEHWGWRHRDHYRNHDNRGERGNNSHNEENWGKKH